MEEKKMQNKMRFKIGEIEFEAEGDAEVIAKERSEFVSTLLPLALDSIAKNANTKQITHIATLPQSSSIDDIDSYQITEDLSRESLASFVKQKGVETNNDFVLCAAFFNEKKNGMKTFSKVTMEESFSEAKRPLPANIYDLFNGLVKNGLIMKSSDKGKTSKEYTLTHNGEEYVNKLSPKQSKAKRPSSKPRKQQKKQK